MATHTRGPWSVVDSGPNKATFYIRTGDDEVAVVYRVHNSDDERYLADAKLIAAAPEQQAKIDALADALEAFVKEQHAKHCSDAGHDRLCERGTAALRLAGRIP